MEEAAAISAEVSVKSGSSILSNRWIHRNAMSLKEDALNTIRSRKQNCSRSGYEVELEVLDAVLTVASLNQMVYSNGDIKFLMHFIRDNLLVTSLTSRVLLGHIDNFSDPLPLLDILPKAFIVPSAAEVNFATGALLKLAERDQGLVVACLSCLVDLPLTAAQAERVVSLACAGLATVEESDLPVLMRLIYHHIDSRHLHEFTTQLRDEVRKCLCVCMCTDMF